MANFVDGVAMTLPWAGGLIPATLTYQNLQMAGLVGWQAFVVAGVVEGMGFVAVTTVIDIYEHNRAEQASLQANTWQAGSQTHLYDGSFWIALSSVLLYLGAVLVINTVLDQSANPAKIWTGGLLSTFGVLGGVMVALRNQLSKRRASLELAESRTRQVEADHAARARADRDQQQQIQLELQRESLEHQRKMQADELRMKHELELKNQDADALRKLEKARADGLRRVSQQEHWGQESEQKSPDAVQTLRMVSGLSAESIRRHPKLGAMWSDVPESDYGWLADAPAGAIVERYGLSGKDPERMARTWKGYARGKLASPKHKSDNPEKGILDDQR
jgi:hypothetical protein